MRTPIMAGNWKMNCDNSAAVALAEGIAKCTCDGAACEAVICPPFTALSAVSQAIADTPIALGGQNLFWEPSGAFTGEISADMLLSCGCSFVIIGHSERRGRFGAVTDDFTDEMQSVFGDNDATVNRKLKAAADAGLKPIACCGELLSEREQGMTDAVVANQVRAMLDGCSPEQLAATTIAYEPVWAIGTGLTATDEQANETIGVIRKAIEGRYGAEVASKVRIQYGGSMNPSNVKGLMAQPEIDGGLIGGASLKAQDFSQVVNF